MLSVNYIAYAKHGKSYKITMPDDGRIMIRPRGEISQIVILEKKIRKIWTEVHDKNLSLSITGTQQASQIACNLIDVLVSPTVSSSIRERAALGLRSFFAHKRSAGEVKEICDKFGQVFEKAGKNDTQLARIFGAFLVSRMRYKYDIFEVLRKASRSPLGKAIGKELVLAAKRLEKGHGLIPLEKDRIALVLQEALGSNGFPEAKKTLMQIVLRLAGNKKLPPAARGHLAGIIEDDYMADDQKKLAKVVSKLAHTRYLPAKTKGYFGRMQIRLIQGRLSEKGAAAAQLVAEPQAHRAAISVLYDAAVYGKSSPAQEKLEKTLGAAPLNREEQPQIISDLRRKLLTVYYHKQEEAPAEMENFFYTLLENVNLSRPGRMAALQGLMAILVNSPHQASRKRAKETLEKYLDEYNFHQKELKNFAGKFIWILRYNIGQEANDSINSLFNRLRAKCTPETLKKIDELKQKAEIGSAPRDDPEFLIGFDREPLPL